jgi:hypothetical protein
VQLAGQFEALIQHSLPLRVPGNQNQ